MYKFIITTLLLTVSTTNYAACNKSIKRTAPDSRYELVNSNTEVKDKQTDLIWQRCSLGQTWSGTSCTGKAATYSSPEALHEWTYVLQVVKNIGSGWRVPNVKELGSLIELACYSPSINEVFFPNTINSNYWSSSPFVIGSNSAWLVSFNYGNDDHYVNYGGYVRLVRSGQ